MHFTPLALPYFFAIAVYAVLGVYALRYKNAPVSPSLLAFSVACGLWCLCFGMEISVDDFGLKVFFAKARFVGLAPLFPCFYFMALSLKGGERAKSRIWKKIFLYFIPAATIVLSLTSGMHRLFRYDYGLFVYGSASVVTYSNGPLFYVYLLSEYGLSVFAAFELRQALRERPRSRRQQVYAMYVVGIVFFAVDVLYQFGVTPVPHFNFSGATMSVNSLIIALAAYRYRMFSLAPITRAMVVDSISDAVLVTDTEGRLIDSNRTANRIFGLTERSSIGIGLREIAPELIGLRDRVVDACLDGEGSTCEVKIPRQGREYVFEVSLRGVYLATDEMVGDLLHLRDVTERKKLLEELREANDELRGKIDVIESLQSKLKEEAIRDTLTGLYNRRYLSEALERQMAWAEREDMPLGMLMTDIDSFKRLNDEKGHQAGDAVLAAVGAFFASRARKSDIACRYGGDEFLLVLPGTGVEEAVALAETYRKAAAELEIPWAGETLRLTMSFGVAVFPSDSGDKEGLVEAADRALYRAKLAGRNEVIAASAGT